MWGFATSKSNLSVTVASQRGVCRLLTPSVFASLWVHLHLRLCVSLQMCVCVFTSTSVCVCGFHSQVSLGLLVSSGALRVSMAGSVSSASIKWLYNTSNLGLFGHFLWARYGSVQAGMVHLDRLWSSFDHNSKYSDEEEKKGCSNVFKM